MAEHLSDYHCLEYLREAFVEILNGLDMPDSDKNYYKWVAGLEGKKMTVYCEQCGKIIGDAKTYSYGGKNNDDHEDYGETKPNEFYGGEFYGKEYCSSCFYALGTHEDSAMEEEI
jgi:hypothetical protein